MSERLWGILVDSFGKILLPGLTVTIPLTVISFTLALIIAVVVALVQFAHVPVLQQIARFYIWVMRGTPVLVQLIVVFYGLPGVGMSRSPRRCSSFPSTRARTAPRPSAPRWNPCPKARWRRGSASA